MQISPEFSCSASSVGFRVLSFYGMIHSFYLKDPFTPTYSQLSCMSDIYFFILGVSYIYPSRISILILIAQSNWLFSVANECTWSPLLCFSFLQCKQHFSHQHKHVERTSCKPIIRIQQRSSLGSSSFLLCIICTIAPFCTGKLGFLAQQRSYVLIGSRSWSLQCVFKCFVLPR